MNLYTENIVADWSLISISELGAFPLISKCGRLLLFVGNQPFCLGPVPSLTFSVWDRYPPYFDCCINTYIQRPFSKGRISIRWVHSTQLGHTLSPGYIFHCTLL
jgi:hypothetical protein